MQKKKKNLNVNWSNYIIFLVHIP